MGQPVKFFLVAKNSYAGRDVSRLVRSFGGGQSWLGFGHAAGVYRLPDSELFFSQTGAKKARLDRFSCDHPAAHTLRPDLHRLNGWRVPLCSAEASLDGQARTDLREFRRLAHGSV